jgi:hypothetical protein
MVLTMCQFDVPRSNPPSWTDELRMPSSGQIVDAEPADLHVGLHLIGVRVDRSQLALYG